MSNIKPTTNSQLPDRLYGEHYPDSFLDVSEPIREFSVATLGDYIQQLQEIDKQPNESCIACEPSKSNQSTYDHICPNNPILTCNCIDPKYCAELGDDPDCQYRDPDQDGFADNIDYTGIPIPAPKRENNSGWSGPCVVVGAVCETWLTASECVPRSEHSAGHTEQHTDAGFNNDGPAATTKL